MHPVLKELFGVFNIDSATNVEDCLPGSETKFSAVFGRQNFNGENENRQLARVSRQGLYKDQAGKTGAIQRFKT
jgi:hypothetical protein